MPGCNTSHELWPGKNTPRSHHTLLHHIWLWTTQRPLLWSWQCSIQAITCSVERISLDLQDLSTRIPLGTDQHMGPSESPNCNSRESHASLIRSIYWNMINEGHNLKLQILQCAPMRCLTDQTLFSLETQLAFSSAGCCYVKSILNLNLPCLLHNWEHLFPLVWVSWLWRMASELYMVKCYPNEGRFMGTHVFKQLGESPFSASAPQIDTPLSKLLALLGGH